MSRVVNRAAADLVALVITLAVYTVAWPCALVVTRFRVGAAREKVLAWLLGPSVAAAPARETGVAASGPAPSAGASEH